MLRVLDLTEYIKNKIVYDNYFINEFPSTSSDRVLVIKLNPGLSPSEWTHKKKPSFQVLVRGGANDMGVVEQKIHEVYNHFHNKLEFFVGSTRIVHCSANQSSPLYIGRDDNNRPIYSINFTCVTM